MIRLVESILNRPLSHSAAPFAEIFSEDELTNIAVFTSEGDKSDSSGILNSTQDDS